MFVILVERVGNVRKAGTEYRGIIGVQRRTEALNDRFTELLMKIETTERYAYMTQASDGERSPRVLGLNERLSPVSDAISPTYLRNRSLIS